MSEKSAPAEISAQVANGSVLVKLFVFSLSLGMVPVVTYFASLKYIWNGSSTYAAISAVVAANIVLVLYIISSIVEDRQDRTRSAQVQPETRKER
ncbi:hypothetical protein AX15_002281 [Amanita polypyramis BW_CC]|nr:hypothetical protein AX15_002281 [Amanita polypyramis BW_CC]